MAISKNNPILKNHFRKNWQERVKTHFDQPGRKASRRNARAKKAAALAPRPLEALRPVVRCPSLRYNRRTRAGRGFTLAEIKAAGLSRHYARTVGIAVDHRRVNRSVEAYELNVARLKEYLSRLIVFPRKGSKSAAESAVQVDVESAFPVPTEKFSIETKAIADVESKDAYRTLRVARANARYAGAREKRARDRAEAEK